MISFKNLNLINPIIRAVTEAGYSRPTEIQCFAVPHILAGHDVVGCSRTGTGKTGAFIMPILQLLKKYPQEHQKIRILMLTPTRELALQIEENLEVYSKYLPLSQLSVFDGVSAAGQLVALRKRVDILIATPERLLELADRKYMDLSRIEILVLDEADTMFEMGFAGDVKKILKLIPHKRQTLFFSAAMPENIQKFAEEVLHKSVEVTVSRFNHQALKKPSSFMRDML